MTRFSANSGFGIRLSGLSLCALSLSAVISQAGCLDRPLAPASPRTSNTLTDKVRVDSVDKIDLLFVIDNSASMADKQAVLAKAVPDLVDRLVNPLCVTPATDTTPATPLPKAQQPAQPSDKCPDGSARDFNPIDDIHIGVLTSSLGGHGADLCEFNASQPVTGTNNPSKNDFARLMSRKAGTALTAAPATVGTYQNAGFFACTTTRSNRLRQCSGLSAPAPSHGSNA